MLTGWVSGWVKAFPALYAAGCISARRLGAQTGTPGSSFLTAKRGEMVRGPKESLSLFRAEDRWDETADRGEGTGEDKEGNQRQGPPTDMVRVEDCQIAYPTRFSLNRTSGFILSRKRKRSRTRTASRRTKHNNRRKSKPEMELVLSPRWDVCGSDRSAGALA